MNTQPKIAWITGASSGIGRALSLALAHEGWVVAVTARSAEALLSLQDDAPKGYVHCYPGDVANSARMRDIIGQITTHLGGLDMVVTCAAILHPDSAQNFSAENFRRTMDTNLCGTANVLEPALAEFQKTGRGHIVLVSSLSAYMGMSELASYGASKAAIFNLAQSLAASLAHTQIKVQVITPSYVATSLINKLDTASQRPLEISRAVSHIMRGLKSKRFEITFPFFSSRALRLISWLPQKISQTLLNFVS